METLWIENFQNCEYKKVKFFKGQKFRDIMKNQLELQDGIVINENGFIVNKQSLIVNNDQIMTYYLNKLNDKNKIIIVIYQDENYFTLNQYDRSVVIEGAFLFNRNHQIIYNNLILEHIQLYSTFNQVIGNKIDIADFFIVDKNFQKQSQILITLYSNIALSQIESENSKDTIFRPKICRNFVHQKNSIVQSIFEKIPSYTNFVFLSEFGILNTHDRLDELYANKNQAILILIPLPHQETNTQLQKNQVLVRLWKFGNFFKEQYMYRNQTIEEIQYNHSFTQMCGKIPAFDQTIEQILKPKQKELNLTLVDFLFFHINNYTEDIFQELLLRKFWKNYFIIELDEGKKINFPLSPIFKMKKVMENNQFLQEINQ